MQAPPPEGFSAETVTLVVGLAGAVATIIVAIVARIGGRQTRLNAQMATMMENLREENSDLREANKELREELRACEGLRRQDFEDAVRRHFPEQSKEQKELPPGE